MIWIYLVGAIVAILVYLFIGVYCAARFSWCFGVSHNGYHTFWGSVLKFTIFPLIVLFWPFFAIWIVLAIIVG